MKMRAPLTLSKSTLAQALGFVATMAVAVGSASAQPAPAAPAAPVAPVAPIPPAEPAPVAPIVAGPVAATPASESNDHDQVVGLWGLEARQIGVFRRTPGEDVDCGNPCNVALNSLGVRKWVSQRYAYSAGLALGVGSGARRSGGDTETFDTYLGVGPSLGASFLLASWKHIAVSLAPRLDLVYFLPSSKGSKSFVVDLRGLVEGELHLGMIGLPTASIGIQSGLVVNYLHATADEKTPVANAVASRWSLGLTGPTSLWNLVTNATIRYYF